MLHLSQAGVISGGGEAPYTVSAIRVDVGADRGGFWAARGSALDPLNLNSGFTYHCMCRYVAHAASYALGDMAAWGWGASEHPAFEIKFETLNWIPHFKLSIKNQVGTYLLSGYSSYDIVGTRVPTDSTHWAGMTISWEASTGNLEWWWSFDDKAEQSLSTTTTASTQMNYTANHYLAFHADRNGTSGHNCLNGGIFHEFFDNQYVDLSIAANRRKFVGDNTTWGVVDPLADGSGFLGSQPVFFSHDGDPRNNVGWLTMPSFSLTGAVEADTTNLPPVL